MATPRKGKKRVTNPRGGYRATSDSAKMRPRKPNPLNGKRGGKPKPR